MSQKILIVEDNKDLAYLLEMHLRDLLYEVDLAFDGDKAGQKANDKAHDLLSHNIINSYIINLGHSDDVGSMEPKVIKKLFGDFCKENKI